MSYLVITGSRSGLEALIEAMTRLGHADWHRDRDAEALDAESGLGDPMYCFRCRATETHRSARVWMHLGEDQLTEVNVIPVEDRRLERSQGEAVLDAFVAEVLDPSLEGTGLHLERRLPNDLATYLTELPRKRLSLFAKLANKGMPHPLDKERWYDFVIAAHSENSELPPSVLEEWLRTQGWAEEAACDLAIEYEQERTILAQYDRTK